MAKDFNTVHPNDGADDKGGAAMNSAFRFASFIFVLYASNVFAAECKPMISSILMEVRVKRFLPPTKSFQGWTHINCLDTTSVTLSVTGRTRLQQILLIGLQRGLKARSNSGIRPRITFYPYNHSVLTKGEEQAELLRATGCLGTEVSRSAGIHVLNYLSAAGGTLLIGYDGDDNMLSVNQVGLR